MLAAEDLAAALTCNSSHTSQAPLAVWELLFSQTTKVLGPALDLLANMVSVLRLRIQNKNNDAASSVV